jgi:hypothetical protein
MHGKNKFHSLLRPTEQTLTRLFTVVQERYATRDRKGANE